MREKWHIKNKKGYLKIHVVAVNVKSKKILSIKVTDEHVHDSKALPELVENILRNLSVISQKKDLQAWKDSVSYGNRWIVETVFSCLKRTFGEHVYSVKLKNMIQEIMLKVSLYNKMISI